MEHADWTAFPPLDHPRWRAIAEKGLRGKSWEDIERPRPDGRVLPVRVDPADPLAAPRGLPDRAIGGPETGQPWQLQQTLHTPEALKQALMHGVEGIRISEAAQQAHGMRTLLDGVYLDMVDVHLDGPEATGLLRGLVEQGLSGEQLTGSCSRDVLRAPENGTLARHVEAWGAAFPRLLTWGCDAAPWIDAGVGWVDALSAVVSGWDAGIQALEAEGIGREAAMAHCTVRWAVGAEVLVEASALRALRMLWAKWCTHHHTPPRPLWIDARTSTRSFVRELPEDNLLRMTAASYAAVLGGADGIETLPHDFREGLSSDAALRYARNVQHLLREESALHLTCDPFQGSHAVEFLTNQAVDAAWSSYLRDAEAGGWPVLWESGEWSRRVERGRVAGLQAPLFLPRDVERGNAPLPANFREAVYFADHQA